MERRMLYWIVSLLVCGFIYSGCEQEKQDFESIIPGKWEISSISINYYLGNIQINSQVETFAPGELVVELAEGGIGYLYEEGIQTATFEWSLDGNILTFPPPDMDPVDGKVNGSKNNLVVTWEEEEEEGGIITILKYRIDARKVI